MDKYLFTINGHDFVTKKCMILEILLYWNVYIKKTMPFRKDILNSLSYHIKSIHNNPKIKVIILNVQVQYNSNIKWANKTMFFKSWHKNDVKVMQGHWWGL